jgi:hypothetical protein
VYGAGGKSATFVAATSVADAVTIASKGAGCSFAIEESYQISVADGVVSTSCDMSKYRHNFSNATTNCILFAADAKEILFSKNESTDK